MNQTISIAPLRKSIVVAATPQKAFDVFTGGVDRWWPKSKGIGATPIKVSIIEPYAGGRWYTTHEDGSEIVIGHVLQWQPAERFVVSWEINADWKSDARPAFTSEVEVRFVPQPGGGTRVELEHRHFERMGEQAGQKMRTGVDGGWPTMLELYAQEAARSG